MDEISVCAEGILGGVQTLRCSGTWSNFLNLMRGVVDERRVTMNPTVASTVRTDYEPGMIRSAKSAYTASLHVLFAHVADFHELVVRIISQKYGIPEEDILRTVMEHPDYSAMQVNPVIQSLGYFDQADVDRVCSPKPVNEIVEVAPGPKPKVVRKKKIVIVQSSA